jgi:hypothetical protein
MADDVVVQVFEQAGAVVQIVEDGVVVQTIDVPTPVVLVETFGFTAHNALDIVSLEAAQALGGHRVVLAAGGNTVDYASSANAGHAGKVIGITTGAVIGGAEADVRVSGEMIDGTFAFVPGPVFFNASGVLTQTPPVAGFIQQVAIAVSATKIIVVLGMPTVLN